MVVAVVVRGGNVNMLGQHVSQPAGRCPAPAAACGGRGRGGCWRGGGGGGGGAVDCPADPVLHAYAPFLAGRGSSAASSVFFFTFSSLFFITVPLTFALWAWGGVWGRQKMRMDIRVKVLSKPWKNKMDLSKQRRRCVSPTPPLWVKSLQGRNTNLFVRVKAKTCVRTRVCASASFAWHFHNAHGVMRLVVVIWITT